MQATSGRDGGLQQQVNGWDEAVKCYVYTFVFISIVTLADKTHKGVQIGESKFFFMFWCFSGVLVFIFLMSLPRIL